MIKTQMTINAVSKDVQEIKVTWDEKEANDLLKNGWVFVHSGVAHQDKMGYCAKPVFILAKLRKAGGK